MDADSITQLVIDGLDDLKAIDIQVLDVRGKTSVTDFMVIASGTSNRQVRALAGRVVEKAKKVGVIPLGTEGESEAEWILVDLGDVVVHIMQPITRDFYQLEKLWSTVDIGKSSSIS